jgi:hypothetical protein
MGLFPKFMNDCLMPVCRSASLVLQLAMTKRNPALGRVFHLNVRQFEKVAVMVTDCSGPAS